MLIVFNAGSSSLKFEVFERDGSRRTDISGAIRDVGKPGATLEFGRERVAVSHANTHQEAARIVLARLFDGDAAPCDVTDVAATGHRIVHGGERFTAPTRVTDSVFAELRAVAALAPLHVPPALDVIAAVRATLPRADTVAVFDTAFFHALPDVARHYAVPAAWRRDHHVRRYGFHGLAHAQMADALCADGRAPRAVTLLLGQGCSAAALRGLRPLDTSMGFTPVEGLVMGTRSGDLDAGILLHMARSGIDTATLDAALNRRSGLLGLSGTSDDVRELLRLENVGDYDATLALAVFVYRIRKYIGAYAAVLGGLDALAFGGGIGENSSALRDRILADFEWLGVAIDRAANEAAIGVEADIAAAGSRVAVRVVAIDEQRAIADATARLLTR